MRQSLAILAALLACGCTAPGTSTTAPGPSHTQPGASSTAAHEPAAGGFLVGAAAGSAAQFQQATGVRPAVVEHYVRPGTSFSAGFAGDAIPLIQLMPYGVPLASVTAGAQDTWLRSYASAVARFGRPVILGFAPEMNGSWYSWGDSHVTPAAYVTAWRHVVTVFRAQNARNVTWLWTVNVQKIGAGGRPSNGVAAVRPWWPGAAWVDWAGIDGYYYPRSETFSTVFAATFTEIRVLTRKPVLIAETAVAPAAGQAVKIPALFAGAQAEKARGLIWFDLSGKRDWQLVKDPAALAAFRAAACPTALCSA